MKKIRYKINNVFYWRKIVNNILHEILDLLALRKLSLIKIKLYSKDSIVQYISAESNTNIERNKLNITSISEEVLNFDNNWLGGLRLLENSKLFDCINISTLTVELGSKLWYLDNDKNIMFNNISLTIASLN